MSDTELGKGSMVSRLEKDHIREISEAFSRAVEGDNPTPLDVASKDDAPGPAVGPLDISLKKTDQKISPVSQIVKDLTLDARRYQHILDNIEESYFEVDLKGNLLFFNGTTMRDLGYAKEELLGLHFHHLMDKDTARKVYDAFHRVFVTGRSNKGFEWKIIKKSKEVLDVESSIALLRGDTGEPVGFRGVVRDISRRKQTERDLRRNEEKYRTILENMEDTYLETDLRGNCLFCNDSLCRVLGYSRDELRNINYRLIIPPEHIKEISTAFNKIYTTGRKKIFAEHELITKDGSTVYLEMSMSLLRSPTGEPIGFCGFGRDVTEKVTARGKLEESERHLRLITDNIRDIIWTMDFDLRFTYLSPSVLRLTGFTPEEIMKMSFKAMVSPVTYAQFERLLAGKLTKEQSGTFSDKDRTPSFEIPLTRKDGSVLWLEVNVDFNRDEDGRAFEIIGIGRDISERKRVEGKLRESEERYRMIAERMTDIIWMADMDLRTLYVTPSVQTVLGFSQEERMRMSVDEQLTPGSLSFGLDALARELALEEEGHGDPDRNANLVLEYYHKDGSTRWMETVISGIRDDQGVLTGLYGVSRDVTDRQRVEKELRESEQRYRMIVENANDIVWTIGLDLQLTYASPANIRVSGFTTEEVLNMALSDLLSPESFALATQTLSEELALEASGQPFDPNRSRTLEVEMHTKDGETVWLEANATFNRNADGTPKEILAVGRDITARKRAEEELRESEEKYRTILESIGDGYWEVDLEGRFTFFNDAMCRVSEQTKEELMGLEAYRDATPETAERMFKAFEEVYRTGTPAELADYEMIKGDGTKGFFEMSASLMRDKKGNPVGFRGITRDVTKRKAMEEALAESEQRYRMIVQNMNEIIWTIGLDLQFTYVSPSSTWMTGYTPEETLKTPLTQLLTPESFAYATQRLADELALEASGEPFDPNRAITIEIEAIHKEGRTFWLEITGTFNRDKNGEITEILVVGKNITERKEVEIELQESERRYRMIVENMHDVICVMDLDFNYTYRSPSNVRITGYSPEEITSIPAKDQITPESYALVEKALAEELENEFGQGPVDLHRSRILELEVYHKDGGTVWIEVTATFIRDDSGKPVEILLTVRDITERRKMGEELRDSEQRYRMIVENMSDMIATTDLNLRYMYQSPSIERITGYSAGELANVPAGERITPESRARVKQLLADALAHESREKSFDWLRTQTIEVEAYNKGGGTTWIEVTPTFTRDENDRPTGILVTGRDITERKKAEEEKGELEKQLMQAQKMETVGRLAGGVAHDFNNMLSVILGYVDLAKLRLAKGHPVLKDIVEIEKAATRSRDITTQLLAFSRKQIIVPKVIDLNDLVARTQKSLIRLIGEDIELRVLPGEDLWAIKFDPSQIEQILINLAVNARDAMFGGGKLTIETKNVTLDDFYCQKHIGFMPGRYVRLSVSDNGGGMDQETLQHIFEPFFTTKEAGKGTGLGLATVYGIVKQNSSFINVYSEPEYGTTFNIYVPRTTEKREVQKEYEEGPAATGAGNILLVEDDPMVLEITKGMLEAIGYGVMVAENPGDALSLCEKHDAIDLIITDVVMPTMSGNELRDKLMDIRSDIAVLFMSGYPADAIAHHGVLEEGVHFLQKPFSLKDLASKVREVMPAN